eukprot:3909601-Alexandrium_andersonii.AAC.1
MVVARLGPTDGVGDDVSRIVVPESESVPGTVQEARRWPPEHARVSGRPRFPKPAMSIGRKVAWWPGGRESVALRAIGPS